MENSIKHIGLQIIEKDLSDFYEEIMKFTPLYSFTLSQDDSYEIFGIKKEVTILNGTCPELDLELFIQNKSMESNFSHVCFYSERMIEMFDMAKRKGYKTYLRRNNGNETLFLSDSNFNLFEIKQA
jgi:hypothetical protein